MNPMVPPVVTMPPTATATATPTYACAYTTIALPGTYTNTIFFLVATTPTITPTPSPSIGSRGVVRNAADWFSYCAMAGLDTSTAPPVDFSKKMFLFRSRLSPECQTTTQVMGLDCRSDMLVMSVHSLTDYTLSCTLATTGYFEGYVVDQDPRPVFWLDLIDTIGSPFCFDCGCMDCVKPLATGVLSPSQPLH
jgi:hypothetical protein